MAVELEIPPDILEKWDERDDCIVKYPDPALLQVAKPIIKPTQATRELVERMTRAMLTANGVGLAANQIGASKRVFVYDCADERGRTARRRGVVVNPVLETSEVPETMPDPDNDDEGCLSVPGESFPTGRADWARVTGLDADGNEITLEGTDLFARMLQHETGHLDGFLYLDRLVGRHARSAKRSVKSHGWGVPGLSWMPGRRKHDAADDAPRHRRPRRGPVPVAIRIGPAADGRDRALGGGRGDTVGAHQAR